VTCGSVEIFFNDTAAAMKENSALVSNLRTRRQHDVHRARWRREC
jgi:hypothetical protein